MTESSSNYEKLEVFLIKQFGRPELNAVAEEVERLICEMMNEAIG